MVAKNEEDSIGEDEDTIDCEGCIHFAICPLLHDMYSTVGKFSAFWIEIHTQNPLDHPIFGAIRLFLKNNCTHFREDK